MQVEPDVLAQLAVQLRNMKYQCPEFVCLFACVITVKCAYPDAIDTKRLTGLLMHASAYITQVKGVAHLHICKESSDTGSKMDHHRRFDSLKKSFG